MNKKETSPRNSLKTEWVTLAILLLMTASVVLWAYFYFKGIDPVLVTEHTRRDTDDPAIWVHSGDPSQSLILGTDKGKNDGSATGKIYAFRLDGSIIDSLTVDNLLRPNNIDVEYGLTVGDTQVDIAVFAERYANAIRVFRLPDMKPLDRGGIPVFEGEKKSQRMPMGIAVYKRPTDGAVFAIVSRKKGPSGTYLWQYKLEASAAGEITGKKVREFGEFFEQAKGGEIEAVAVDDELGFVYYSDEFFGVRKYHADPDHPDAAMQLGVLATENFRRDREGIAIYAPPGGAGYVIVSDQQANMFRLYPRQGAAENPHFQPLMKSVRLSTSQTDGIDVTHLSLGERFPAGLFVAMSDDRTFQFYDWRDIIRD